MTSIKQKNIYLFSPSFFSYDHSIKNELSRQGAHVYLHDERPFNSTIGKAIIRANKKKLMNRYLLKYYMDIILPKINSIDYIIFINPETIQPFIIKEIKSLNPSIKIIVYMWDSFKNKPSAIKLIKYSDSFITFDPNDAKNYNLKFLPLFFIPEYSHNNHLAPSDMLYNFSFIGTAHSDRYDLVNKITDSFDKLFKFFYTPSKFVFLYKKYILKELAGLPYNSVSTVPMSREQVITVVQNSSIIIDINHPLQVGLTMRTIETLGAKKKLITTNKEVAKYDFYHPNNILIFTNETSTNDIIDFAKKSLFELKSDIYHSYSLQNWIRRLFS